MRKVIKKVIRNDEVGSVGEALADAALKESDHVQTTGQMKKVANDGKRAKKRNIMPPGSCVDPKDKRRGPVKSASDLQLEIANIFHHLEQEKLKKLLLNSPTNVVLSVVQNWNDLQIIFYRFGVSSHHI